MHDFYNTSDVLLQRPSNTKREGGAVSEERKQEVCGPAHLRIASFIASRSSSTLGNSELPESILLRRWMSLEKLSVDMKNPLFLGQEPSEKANGRGPGCFRLHWFTAPAKT